MVRAVYKGMAIKTSLTHHIFIETCQGITVIESRGMRSHGVAALAKIGNPHGEKCFLVRTVGIMAIATVFPNRGMFPDKRSTLLHVASITVFIKSLFFKQGRPQRAVGIVAVSAAHLSVSKCHMRGPLHSGPDFYMAADTSFCNEQNLSPLLLFMDTMAGKTPYPFKLMSTTHPLAYRALFMTAKA